MSMKIFRESASGFTLVETLVAIAIISIGIIGPFQVVQGVLKASYIARDELIASALAQEGVEYVRQVRDSNAISKNHTGGSASWLQGLDGNLGPNCYTNACVVDAVPMTATSCGNTTCAGRPLYLSQSNLYNQSLSGGVTPFTRKVRLTLISATETLVTVTVSWNYHGVHSVVLVEDLQDWL